LRLADLDYELPERLIAQRPTERREDARLMVLAGAAAPRHDTIEDLPDRLPAGAIVVLNDTRVDKARLRGTRVTGGAAELLLLREPDGTFRAMGRANKPLREGHRLEFGGPPAALVAWLEGRDEEGLWRVRLEAPGGDVEAMLERLGEVPLPPYVHRRPDHADAERYQTVFARHPGAVAAPTAGLHLTEALMTRMRARGIEIRHVTLHVGPGTFAPVTVDDLDEHAMHTEHYDIPSETADAVSAARREGRPVIAVGTTVVRTLESACDAADHVASGAGETRLLLQVGDRFRIVDALLTNFHVPRSTLLALVMAFAGRDRILAAYAEAVRSEYRFFSYGDAMLILP
jgi:S-adenosylmethionine:tRNA ribosyltransferase-isomerase